MTSLQVTLSALKELWYSGPVVNCLKFDTTCGKSHGPYGSGSCSTSVAVSDKTLRYIAGSSGNVVDSLTFYFA